MTSSSPRSTRVLIALNRTTGAIVYSAAAHVDQLIDRDRREHGDRPAGGPRTGKNRAAAAIRKWSPTPSPPTEAPLPRCNRRTLPATAPTLPTIDTQR